MKTRNVLSLSCAVALIHGSSSFAPGGVSSPTTTRPQHEAFPPRRRRRVKHVTRRKQADSSLKMSSPHVSNLFSYKATEESLVNNRYSASDWLHNVFTLPRSSVLRDIKNPVLTIALWSTLVSIVYKLLANSGSKAMARMASDMCIASGPHSFLVSSLGLLLVFRTNSAYQRFNEGRVIWEKILSISRNISRMTPLYNKEVGKDRQRRIANLIASFPYLLRHHVRPGCLCESQDKSTIPAEDRLVLLDTTQKVVDSRYEGDKGATPSWRSERECYVNRRNFPWSLFHGSSLKRVARTQNRPLWVCDRVGREITSIPYGLNFTSRERLSLLKSVEKLTDCIGQCERIHQTAVPLNYARHSLRALTLWLVTLPFALIKDMGFLTGPVMAVISWLLFGVYQIGYSIEDPFQGSLRLSILCDAIRKDVLGETLGRESAFDLDDWEDEHDWEDDGDDVSEDETLRELELVKQSFKPYIPPANHSEWILSAPSLVQQNGSWNVVGIHD